MELPARPLEGSLVGHSDSNASEDNYFFNINSRGPSRFGTGHAYNNYYVNMSTAVHSRMGAQFLVQNNVFSNVTTPIQTTSTVTWTATSTSRAMTSVAGPTRSPRPGSFTSPPYTFGLHGTSSVSSAVPAGAGTGKVG